MRLCFFIIFIVSFNLSAEDKELQKYSFDKKNPKNLLLAILNKSPKRITKYFESSSDFDFQFNGKVETFYINPFGFKKKEIINVNGWSPLIAAFYTDDAQTINRLLTRDIDVNLQTSNTKEYTPYPEGTSALHLAFSNSALDLIEKLIQKGGNLKIKNSKNEYPFQKFSLKSTSSTSYHESLSFQLETINTLKLIFNSYTENELNSLFDSEVPVTLSKFYPKEAKISQNFIIKMIQGYQMNWCQSEHPAYAKIVDELQANIKMLNLNYQNELGMTPLIYALEGLACSTKAVKFLLENNANPCLKDFKERTPLEIIHLKYQLNSDYKRLLGDSERLLIEEMKKRNCYTP